MLVVSKGDDELLALDGRRAMHFPQDDAGGYAGHYPADDREAIEHLEALRSDGATHLLFPQTATWWLDHYRGLRDHLTNRYAACCADDTCQIFVLHGVR